MRSIEFMKKYIADWDATSPLEDAAEMRATCSSSTRGWEWSSR